MSINSDEQLNAALSWTKALTKNKDIVTENSNRLIPKGSKLNLKNPPRIKRKLSAWKGRTDRQAFWLKHNLIKKTLPGEAGEIFDELKMARAEILGSKEYDGAKLNIQNFSIDVTKNLADDEIQLSTLINLWFKNLNGFKLDKDQKRLIDQIPNINSRNSQKISEDMISSIEDEESFLKSSLSLLNALKLLEQEKSEENEENEKFDEQSDENEESLSDDLNEIESDEEPSNEIDLMQSLVDEMPDEQEILQEAEVSIDEELEANVDFDDNQIGKENSDYSVFTTQYDEIISAAEILSKDYGIDSDVWSVTSFNELRRDGMETERWNLLNPDEKRKKSYVQKCLSKRDGPIVAASDYTRSFSDQIRPYVEKPFYSLGTDGYGRSDTRKNLRNFFEVDKKYIVTYALSVLSKEQLIASKYAEEAIKKYNIDKNKPMPTKL